jgi:hypothetical protein
MLVYLYIFGGSYVLFFFVTWLYVSITRRNTVAVYRAAGWSDEKIREHVLVEENKGRSMANRSTLVNGSLFGFLIALVYAVGVYTL